MHKYQARLIETLCLKHKMTKPIRRLTVMNLRNENRKGAMPLPR